MLTLKEAAYLNIFCKLYADNDVDLLIEFIVTRCYDLKIFEKLSMYLFVRQFYYAKKVFDGRLGAINCILFTFIALSDRELNIPNTSFIDSVDGGMLSIVFYFYSII